jgi:hypothetical protein
MAGVTDKPFRLLCKRLGAGLAVSEMTNADPRLWRTRKSLQRMDHEGEPEPVSVQIAGYDPAMLAEAARYNADNGAQIIDINMGCPAKKVCNVWSGSALLQDEPLVARIVKAVVDAVDVPVTLKIRTGWDRQNRNALAIAKIAEDAGIAALAVHGRTRADKYEGNAEYETIAAVKASVRIPVFANGDVVTPQQARHVLDVTWRPGSAVDLPRDQPLPEHRRDPAGAHARRSARHPRASPGTSLRVLRRVAGRAHRAQAPGLVRQGSRRERRLPRGGEPRRERARPVAPHARLLRRLAGRHAPGGLSPPQAFARDFRA